MLLLVNYRVFEVWCLTSMLHHVSVAALAFRLRPSSRCHLPLLSPFCSYFYFYRISSQSPWPRATQQKRPMQA
ncbi:hypothetical protein B0T13DRAFT_463497 [Neurospora crassa]|nr:hypothetical protein B0T13DRAFT_463497 [Neurospora crassa]